MKNFLSRQGPAGFVLLLVLGSLSAYIVIRSVTLDITNDEAYSFHNAKKFWYAEVLCSANTHWINLGAIRMMAWLNFENNWQIRWFSVLSGLAFFGAGYFWSREEKDPAMKFFMLFTVFLNPVVIDYFSLARGYSSGLMFQALALLFLISGQRNGLRSRVFASLAFAGLSAISNYTFCFFFAAFSVVYFYECHLRSGTGFLRSGNFYLDLAWSLGITVFVFRALWFIKECSDSFGAFSGEEMAGSVFGGLIEGWAYLGYSTPFTAPDWVAWLLCGFILLASVLGAMGYNRHGSRLYAYSGFMVLFMLGLLAMNHFLFRSPYPSGRTCLMLYPLFGIVAYSSVNYCFPAGKLRSVGIFVLSAALAIHFISGMNFRYTYDCFRESCTREYFGVLEASGAKRTGITSPLYGVYANYYQLTEDHPYSFSGTRVPPVHPGAPENNKPDIMELTHLVLAPPFDLSGFKKTTARLKVIRIFPLTGVVIMEVIP